VARKKRDQSEQEADEQEQTKSEATPVISANRLKKLLGTHRAAVRDAAQIAQALGSELKEAQKNHHLHLGAFKLAAKLDKMEPEELRSFMDHFDYYYDASGLKKRADSVQRLPMGDDDEGEDDTNVAQFPDRAA
jgi:hypothetical protein